MRSVAASDVGSRRSAIPPRSCSRETLKTAPLAIRRAMSSRSIRPARHRVIKNPRHIALIFTVFVSAVTVLGTVACLVSLWRVSRFARGQHAVGGGIAAGAGGVLSILLNPDGPDLELFVVLGLVIVTVVTVGRSRARHDASEREIESLRRERAIADDRLRLARDIHDSLSHRLSLIAIHSGAMDYRRDLSRDQSAESIGVIHRESQAAVSDLRDIILTLRTPHQDEGGAYSPYDVIEKARERGQAVNVSTGFPSDTALLAGLSTTALTALVATLRECLNNADRHAQGTRVAVEARLSAGWLTVTVINPLEVSSLSDVDAPLTGFGLRGVRERAELAEGRLVVEKAGGEFVVTISLPWKDSAE